VPVVSQHREKNERPVAPHLPKRSFANHFDRPEVIETQFRTAKPEKGGLLLSVLQELPLLPLIRYHRVRLQSPLELDAP
jgi:hypothetical protein